ncbi:hypothetical protein GCM10010156_78210 [Planobispora rosea]|uniref:Membrane protein n=1 Tax=Planobispora rosea TaxID=35762 RepID=B5LSY7_PLARO|nr:hypothetical protein [Planobispora rosea]ACG70934.1 membrane protein [Planobispora rosea]GGT10236.1 hypothetical protein GCM10010156_78210 [Planobispora rosea]GIH85014.1 hypothetical protein Pro02_34220 [Planobispora rosea]
MPPTPSFWNRAGNLALITVTACGSALVPTTPAQAASHAPAHPLAALTPTPTPSPSATPSPSPTPSPSSEPSGEPESVDTLAAVAAAPITRSQMIARAKTWNPGTSKRVPYSQTKTRGGYRTDCSGYVSMALGLGKPGPITVGLAKSTYTRPIRIADLRRGDLLIDAIGSNTTRHVVIFDRWADAGRTSYWAYEQRGGYGTDYRKRSYGLSSGSEYKPYRALNIREDAPVPPPTITRAQVIARAKSWNPATAQRVPYSQTKTRGGYRTDGSGYVSMALGLGKPGPITVDLVKSAYTRPIAMSQLLQGDLVIDPVGGNTARMVVIFDRWADAKRTSYWAYQQRAGYGTDHRVVTHGLRAGTQFRAYRPVRIR